MESNNEFAYILEYVIAPVRSVIEKECDQEFVKQAALCYRDDADRLKLVEEEFHTQRQRFKQECYGRDQGTDEHKLRLDERKVAAVLCRTYLRYKAFSFDSQKAKAYIEEKKKNLSALEYTKWAVNNVLANYKFAYLASIQLVYISLMAELCEKKADEPFRQMMDLLNETGRLFRFQSDPKYDTVETNIIVGLARGDKNGQELNMMLYAMLLHQREIYTRERLRWMISGK